MPVNKFTRIVEKIGFEPIWIPFDNMTFPIFVILVIILNFAVKNWILILMFLWYILSTICSFSVNWYEHTRGQDIKKWRLELSNKINNAIVEFNKKVNA